MRTIRQILNTILTILALPGLLLLAGLGLCLLGPLYKLGVIPWKSGLCYWMFSPGNSKGISTPTILAVSIWVWACILTPFLLP